MSAARRGPLGGRWTPAGHCHGPAPPDSREIPLERATGQIERQLPFRCCPQTEVQDVRVTAQLDVQPGVGGPGQIGGHHRGGTPIERPGRDRHSIHPYRHQRCQPRGVLAQHDRQRVVAACRRIPRGQLLARKPLPSGATRRDPVNPRRWGGEHPPRCCIRIAQRRSTVPTGSDRRRLVATVRGPSTPVIGSHDRPAVAGESASPSPGSITR
jgi:hypothetical protein